MYRVCTWRVHLQKTLVTATEEAYLETHMHTHVPECIAAEAAYLAGRPGTYDTYTYMYLVCRPGPSSTYVPGVYHVHLQVTLAIRVSVGGRGGVHEK